VEVAGIIPGADGGGTFVSAADADGIPSDNQTIASTEMAADFT